MENLEIRIILKFLWKKGLTARAAVKEICDMEGNGYVSKTTAAKWFKRFAEGDTSFNDLPRTGRPISFDSEILCKAVNDNPKTSTRRLSAKLGASQSTITRHLHKVGKVNKRFREIPHELTPAQAKRRVDTCRKLLQNPKDDRWFKQLVTGDEKWVYFSNPDKGNQWLDHDQLAEVISKRDRFSKKAMLCVWWNYEGIIYFEVLPNNISVNAELYSTQLERMHAALSLKYPALVNRKRVILQQDNATAHTSTTTRKKIQELESIELLPHPAYSPDLAPSDFYLFRSMAHFLSGRSFANIEELEMGCREFFDSKPREWYRRGIQELAQRWVKCIECDGVYFKI